MRDVPPCSLGAAANITEWIWEEALDGRLQRITAIYRRFVLGEGAVEYPTAEEIERLLPTVAEEPTDFDLG